MGIRVWVRVRERGLITYQRKRFRVRARLRVRVSVRLVTCQRKRLDAASIPDEGSSSRTSCGLPMSAMPTQSLRCEGEGRSRGEGEGGGEGESEGEGWG